MKNSFNPQPWRKEFPCCKKLVYLDHASMGPIPKSSIKVASDFYRYLTFERVHWGHTFLFMALEKSRKLAARLIGAKSTEIGISPNTSYGFNLVAQGLKLKRGDTVLLSEAEFPANVYPWMNLKRQGVRIRFIQSRNGFFSVENLKKAINRSTKVLSLSFVQFFNGYKNDLETIGKLCAEKGLTFVVDGMQGIGSQALDVKKCKIDFLSCGGGKWLLSAPGAGFFYASEKLQEKLEPVFFGWLGVDWHYRFGDLLHFDKPPFASARKFEIGTYPYAELQILACSLKLISKIGIRNIQAHTGYLLDILVNYLGDSRYRTQSSLEAKHRSSILSFTCRGAEKLHQKLFRNRILCSFREGNIRVSPHFYNTETEIYLLIEILGQNRGKSQA